MADQKETILSIEQGLAYDQGKAFTQALDFLKKEAPSAEVVNEGYIITILFGKATGMYVLQPEGDLQWAIPRHGQNLYSIVVARDQEDLRFVPDLLVYCHLYDAAQNLAGDQRLYFTWHPFLYHYGSNWEISTEGDYTATIVIETPRFPRLDQDKGKRYPQSVTVELGPLHLTGGREEYGPK